jgi:putative endonuclease
MERPLPFWVYMVADRRNGTIYTGQTDNLAKRATEHREGLRPGFSKKYRCKIMVWAEAHPTRSQAFIRERRIKEWRRSWKLMLIEEHNPTWKDLFEEVWREDRHWLDLAARSGEDAPTAPPPYDRGPGIRRDAR